MCVLTRMGTKQSSSLAAVNRAPASAGSTSPRACGVAVFASVVAPCILRDSKNGKYPIGIRGGDAAGVLAEFEGLAGTADPVDRPTKVLFGVDLVAGWKWISKRE